TRVATTTSKPASRAARATGRRCDQKYQSSVTRKSSFGRSAILAALSDPTIGAMSFTPAALGSCRGPDRRRRFGRIVDPAAEPEFKHQQCPEPREIGRAHV